MEKKLQKTISYRLQLIASTRFMARSLLNLFKDLAGETHKIKCKCEHDDKKCETCGIK